jgi:hypothetical protein
VSKGLKTKREEQWLMFPVVPAPVWLTLGSVAHAFGAVLYQNFETRTISGLTLADAEAWALRQLSPRPNERKTIRIAIREMIKAEVLVQVEGGIQLLYATKSYEDHHAMVAKPSTNGEAKVAKPSANGAATIHQPSGNGAPTGAAKFSETLQHDSPLEREREEKNREREEGGRLEDDEEESEEAHAVRWNASVQLRFRKLHMDAKKGDPSMAGKAEAARFPERLANTARSLGRDPLELLEECFAKWLAEKRPGAKDYSPYSAFVARFDNYAIPPERDARKPFMRASKPEDFEGGKTLSDVLSRTSGANP